MTTAAACDAACAEKGAGCWRAAYYDGSGGSSPSDGSGGGGGGDCQLKVGGLPFSLGLTAVTTIIGTAAQVGIAGSCLFKAAANPSLWAKNMIAHAGCRELYLTARRPRTEAATENGGGDRERRRRRRRVEAISKTSCAVRKLRAHSTSNILLL